MMHLHLPYLDNSHKKYERLSEKMSWKYNINMAPQPRCDGSDGKAEDSRLKSPGFNSQLSQEKFSCFWLVALARMRYPSNYLPHCCKYT